jgi:hypothetical protein
VDVWIVLWVDVFEFWMERRIAGAGKTGIAIIDLDEGITVMEVGASALRESDPVVLGRSDPGQEQHWER